MTADSAKFKFETTADGSPTLRIHDASGAMSSSEPCSEAMHSFEGAFSETSFIYGSAIREAHESMAEPAILSVGLGLGYVETLSAAIALGFEKERSPHSLRGESLESDADLRKYYSNWARLQNDVPEDFLSAYQRMLEFVGKATGADQASIRSSLGKALDSGAWKIRGALNKDSQFETQFNCICFDAFSSKTNPELWTESFLIGFLKAAAAPRCVFASYAFTGALKRSLKAAGFQIAPKHGFAGKRESAYARKGF